jgi:prolyl 4-hydroxylase
MSVSIVITGSVCQSKSSNASESFLLILSKSFIAVICEGEVFVRINATMPVLTNAIVPSAMCCYRSTRRCSTVLLSIALVCLARLVRSQDGSAAAEAVVPPPPQHCEEWTGAQCEWEPNLKLMTAEFGPTLKEPFYAYVTPDVATFYNKTAGSLGSAVKPRLSSVYAKFVNLSPQELFVWYVPEGGGQKSFTARVEPFGSGGLASYSGHRFVATLDSDGNGSPVAQWQVTEAAGSNYHYDPYGSTKAAKNELDEYNLAMYQMQLQNLVFAQQYRKVTGRDWLALYKQKMPPRYHMWRADAFGQTHAVETKEIHFVEVPDRQEIGRGMSVYGPRPDQVGRMRKYRDTHVTLNLTLTVLSCAPRVFEIKNFLSDVEVQHILDVARETDLVRSTVVGGTDGSKETSDVRTSQQSWMERHRDFVIDAIYKRAADVLQMNEALLRLRRKNEIPEFVDSDIGVAERLQLVNYKVGQEYQAHFDFAMPDLVRSQPSRFATMLFYLNDDMEGGETTFPNWVNAESADPLVVRAST